jgi:hypothetical protein
MALLGRLTAWLTGGTRAKSAHSYPRLADLGTLSIVEVSDAEPLAGPLFFKVFRTGIPRFPRHFVILRHKAEANACDVLGYVHYTKREGAYLAGGLVVNAMEFRRLDPETAELVRQQGGLAEWLMRTTCNWLPDAKAIFAYIGDTKSRTVNLRVGFRPTEHKYVHVLPKEPCDIVELKALVDEVATIGPF